MRKVFLSVAFVLLSILSVEAASRVVTVDGSLPASNAASDMFATMTEALAALTDGTAEEPTVLRIMPGVYWLDDPDDTAVRHAPAGSGTPFATELRCSHLHIIGMGESPEDVVLAVNRGQMQGALGNYTMLHLIGDDIEVENMTFGNYCNVDLVYPHDPSQNRVRRSDAITQAQLVICNGEGYTLRNCRFISRLNACPFVGGRKTYFNHCYIECGDDALNGNALYRECELHFFSSKPFYATYGPGAALVDCDIYVANGRQYFTKAGGPLTIIGGAIHGGPDTQLAWTPYPEEDLRCYVANVKGAAEYGLMADEHTVNISKKNQRYVFDIDYENYFDDVADNMAVALEIEAKYAPRKEMLKPSAEVSRSTVLVQSGDTVILHPRGRRLNGNMTLQLFFPEWWNMPFVETDAATIEPLSDGTCRVVTHLEGDEPRTVHISLQLPIGLQTMKAICIVPSPLSAPSFAKQPKLKVEKDTVKVQYALALEDRDDESIITWYRCDDASGKGAVKMAVSRGHNPLTAYALQPGDEGHFIMAEVQPAHCRTLKSAVAGVVRVVTKKPVKLSKNVDVLHYATDFKDFPADAQPLLASGYWTLDGFKPADVSMYDWTPRADSWCYTTGYDGATGEGLAQKAKGARMRYTPTKEQTGDMKATLIVDPFKPVGQGFGSATGQYMDVCIAFDTEHLSGYGLRIERVPSGSRSVVFSLVEYKEGVVTVLTPAVVSNCYKTGCTLEVALRGGMLTAHAASPAVTEAEGDAVPVVDLSASVASPSAYGFMLQHTGSAGASATMLHHLEIEWTK